MSCQERSRLIACVPQEHQTVFSVYGGGSGSDGADALSGWNPGAERGRPGNGLERHGRNRDRRAGRQALHPVVRRAETAGFPMARALAQDTPVLILPWSPPRPGISKISWKVFEILRTLAAKGKLILACTHDPNHVKWFCDQVLILKEGEVMARGARSAIR